MDPSRIEPGQRYARVRTIGGVLVLRNVGLEHRRPLDHEHPIIEPERLHEIPVGSRVLNVATGAEFEWTVLHVRSVDTSLGLAPLLALVATKDVPVEDSYPQQEGNE